MIERAQKYSPKSVFKKSTKFHTELQFPLFYIKK